MREMVAVAGVAGVAVAVDDETEVEADDAFRTYQTDLFLECLSV
jgi:hypothetical protein